MQIAEVSVLQLPDIKIASPEYPIEFLKTADEKYNINEIFKLHLPIAVVGLFSDADPRIRIKIVTSDFLELGNIIPHIKITKAQVIANYTNLAEYGLIPDSDIIICTLPASGPEVFGLAGLCDNYITVPQLIRVLVAGLESVSTNEKAHIIALDKIYDAIKKDRVLSNTIRTTTIRSLISRVYTRYGRKLDDEVKAPKVQRKKIFKMVPSNASAIMPVDIPESDVELTLSEKLRYWSNYKKIAGDCSVYTEENSGLIEKIMRIIEDCIYSPTNTMMTIPKAIELVRLLLSDKNFCYGMFKSNSVKTRLNILSQQSTEFPIAMKAASVDALKIIINDEIKAITRKYDPDRRSGDDDKTPQLVDPILGPQVLFNVDDLKYSHLSATNAMNKLRVFVPFIDALDLTKSFVTGSCIAYCTGTISEIHDFPPVYTVPTDWKQYTSIMNEVYQLSHRDIYYKLQIRARDAISAEVTLTKVDKKDKEQARAKPFDRRRRRRGDPDTDLPPPAIGLPLMTNFGGFERPPGDLPVFTTIGVMPTVATSTNQIGEQKEPVPLVINTEQEQTAGQSTVHDSAPKKYEFKMNITDGADIDIGVETESVREFDDIAIRHFAVINGIFPFAKLKKVDRTKGYYYSIYTDDPLHNLTFRKIDIFMAKKMDVLTFHLYPVRGMYTVINNTKSLYVSASCVYGMTNHDMDYFCYFKSMRQHPEEIVLKYLQRGYYVQMPRNIMEDMNKYMEESEKWKHIDDIYTLVNDRLENEKYLYGNFNLFHANNMVYNNGWKPHMELPSI